MKLVLTFNLRRSLCEDEAEFDREETVSSLTTILESLGHEVVPIEVSCPVEELVARLTHAAPDLVFNLAEGRRGPFREAFYPALFDELGISYTGSAASVLALCLDKTLSKRVVAAAGVRAPGGRLVRSVSQLGGERGPVIVKPNFEGSSKGITQASVVLDPRALPGVVEEILLRYPEGVLVEEFVDGMDVSVGWVEGLGVLTPVSYAYEPTGPHHILDLELKDEPGRVRTQIPARLGDSTREALALVAGRTFEALGVRGYGRADFRVSADGGLHFLEMNPLPSLAPEDDELYASAAWIGKSPSDLLGSIVAAGDSRRR